MLFNKAFISRRVPGDLHAEVRAELLSNRQPGQVLVRPGQQGAAVGHRQDRAT